MERGSTSDPDYRSTRIADRLEELSEGILPLVSTLLGQKRVLVVEDAFDASWLSQELVIQPPIRSLIGYPLHSGDMAFGVALIGFREPHTFTHEELLLCEQSIEQVRLSAVRTSLLDEFQTIANGYTIELEKANMGLLSEVTERLPFLDIDCHLSRFGRYSLEPDGAEDPRHLFRHMGKEYDLTQIGCRME